MSLAYASMRDVGHISFDKFLPIGASVSEVVAIWLPMPLFLEPPFIDALKALHFSEVAPKDWRGKIEGLGTWFQEPPNFYQAIIACEHLRRQAYHHHLHRDTQHLPEQRFTVFSIAVGVVNMPRWGKLPRTQRPAGSAGRISVRATVARDAQRRH